MSEPPPRLELQWPAGHRFEARLKPPSLPQTGLSMLIMSRQGLNAPARACARATRNCSRECGRLRLHEGHRTLSPASIRPMCCVNSWKHLEHLIGHRSSRVYMARLRDKAMIAYLSHTRAVELSRRAEPLQRNVTAARKPPCRLVAHIGCA